LHILGVPIGATPGARMPPRRPIASDSSVSDREVAGDQLIRAMAQMDNSESQSITDVATLTDALIENKNVSPLVPRHMYLRSYFGEYGEEKVPTIESASNGEAKLNHRSSKAWWLDIDDALTQAQKAAQDARNQGLDPVNVCNGPLNSLTARDIAHVTVHAEVVRTRALLQYQYVSFLLLLLR
jgi:hypothetical protein